MEWERTQEDEIIAMLHETGATNYCDPSFAPSDESLYRNPQFPAEYDATANSGPLRWLRCTEFAIDPEYFKDTTPRPLVTTGRCGPPYMFRRSRARNLPRN